MLPVYYRAGSFTIARSFAVAKEKVSTTFEEIGVDRVRHPDGRGALMAPSSPRVPKRFLCWTAISSEMRGGDTGNESEVSNVPYA
jgi:hypothetical protein